MAYDRLAWRAAATMALTGGLAGCAGGPAYYHTKPGLAMSTYSADDAGCFKLAQEVAGGRAEMPLPLGASARDPSISQAQVTAAHANAVTNSTAAGRAGTAIGVGLAQGLNSGKAMRVAYDRCMAHQGYAKRLLPEAEEAALRQLPEAERIKRAEALMLADPPQHPPAPIE